jgi:hypothetical protein
MVSSGTGRTVFVITRVVLHGMQNKGSALNNLEDARAVDGRMRGEAYTLHIRSLEVRNGMNTAVASTWDFLLISRENNLKSG